jgi:hypothetical protein
VRDASDLVLPVDRVAVVLRLVDGSRREVKLFVPAGDDLQTLLESTTNFLPAAEDGRIRLYARAALMCVSVPFVPRVRSEESGMYEAMPRECRATIHLFGGEAITGMLRYLAPRERRRPADFLNEESRSFILWSEQQVHYIAKAHVTCVEELGA